MGGGTSFLKLPFLLLFYQLHISAWKLHFQNTISGSWKIEIVGNYDSMTVDEGASYFSKDFLQSQL